MNDTFETKAKELNKKQKRKRRWAKILGFMACIVVFCTTYALILPAITMEGETFCGIEAHEHTEECYEKTLICGQEETSAEPTHVHTADCYETQEALICTLEETEGHTHTADCETVEKSLSCTLEETEGHTHTADCETVEQSLTCTLEENEEHTHDEGCYETVTTITCGLEESEGHTHGDDCYTETTAITCGLEETEGHTHGDDCYSKQEVLICGQDDAAETVEAHTHTDACYEETLVCGKEEHTHEQSCYADPTADLETAADWEDTLPEQLTGEYAVDVLEIAKTQLGYQESTRNFTVLEDGSTKGYSRYGAWYGDPYGDWCAMFVSFCLSYAEVEDFPLDANCQNWIDTLEALELRAYQADPDNYHEYYAAPAGYEPQPGDIIFFNWDDNPVSDHVGLVYAYIPATEHTTAQVKTIEGNSADKVQYVTYELSDDSIMGYGRLPEQYFYCGYTGHVHETCDKDCDVTEHIHTDACLVAPEETEAVEEVLAYFCGLDAHTHDESCYDENGDLVCGLEEHTHTAECLVSPLHICGHLAHTHTEECYDESGALVCELEEHEHEMDCFSDREVGRVILLIDELPTYEEVEAALAAFEEADDMDGYEAYYMTISDDGSWAYMFYNALSDSQKEQIYNIDRLMDLAYIWSVSAAIDEIQSDDPTTVTSASTKDFIDLNLYDYDSGVNDNWDSDKDWPGFQWNGGAYLNGTYTRRKIDYIDFGNSMITDYDYAGSSNGKATTAKNVGNQGGNINVIVEYPSDDYANKPVGMSNGTEVLSRTLVDGYPWVINAGSMEDYFSDSSFATKQNTSSIDGLFQIDSESGAYYYNSRWNHAQYSNNKFTLYEDIITPNFITYPFGNFLPLNDITNSSNATQVGAINVTGGVGDYVQAVINDLVAGTEDATEQQLIDMLARYRTNLQAVTSGTSTAWLRWTAMQAIQDYIGNGPTSDTSPITTDLLDKMYNIDWDVDTNFFFGMDMTMNFIQPKDGLTGNDNNKDGTPDYDMIFYFTGDDDVWVYIDGVLFLDLSGIHRHVGGEIDFVNGEVRYYALDTATGDVSTTAYATYTFAELLTAAGASTDGLNSKGTFKDYTTHQFKFYYTERGSGSSVCRLNFNFPLLRQNSISVSKEVSSDVAFIGDADYKFQILKANSDGTKTNELFIGANVAYDIYAADDITHSNKLGSGTTDANGVITLKAGQQAVFEGIQENAGKYYVRELLEGTVLEQYGNVTVSGESTTTSNNVTIGSDTFTGYDSPVKDMSDGATAFRFTNDVDEDKLSDLTIRKELDEYLDVRPDASYKIEVTLDGTALPVGTSYTVTDAVGNVTTKTVDEAGIIVIKADETATISNILAGTAFTVKETTGSAQGYLVTYTETSGNYTLAPADGVSGVIKAGADVRLVVLNTEKGATVEIPVTKTLVNPEAKENGYTYTFRMIEVTDSTGETETGEATVWEIPVSAETPTDAIKFTLNYVENTLTAAGISLPHTFYYKLTEVSGEDDFTDYDETVYVVAVTVTADMTASVTGFWKDGTKITDSAEQNVAFENTLLGSLSLEKQISGADTGDSFTFAIKLTPGDSGAALPETYSATFYQQDDSEVETTVYMNENNEIVLTGFKHGEKAVIYGIPVGTKWVITETETDGYSTGFIINGETIDGTSVDGSITQGENIVTCVNTTLYELPETGGSGTRRYTMLGAAFLLLGIATLFSLKRRERRAAQ